MKFFRWSPFTPLILIVFFFSIIMLTNSKYRQTFLNIKEAYQINREVNPFLENRSEICPGYAPHRFGKCFLEFMKNSTRFQKSNLDGSQIYHLTMLKILVRARSEAAKLDSDEIAQAVLDYGEFLQFMLNKYIDENGGHLNMTALKVEKEKDEYDYALETVQHCKKWLQANGEARFSALSKPVKERARELQRQGIVLKSRISGLEW